MRHPSWSLLLPLSLIATNVAGAQSPQERLLAALQANRLALTMSDGRPAGPGWDWIVQEARNARFTLIGEEHGVAETAQLSAALYAALHASGYNRVASSFRRRSRRTWRRPRGAMGGACRASRSS